MKKVESVEQQEDGTVEWKAQIFWSHRSWTAEIIDQVPNERIVWRSEGEMGHVDGAVTFHELTPDLTRMLINLEYYPKGFFEHVGNLWRAPGRRARLELKFFRRYLTSEVLLRQDEVEGWPGEIHDGEVTEEASDSKDQGSEHRPHPVHQPRALRNRPPPQHRRAGLALLRRSRHLVRQRQAAQPRLRSRRRRPREAGRDDLWQRLKYRTRSKAHRSRSKAHRSRSSAHRIRSGGLGSVSSKARWSAIDARLRMLYSSSIGASAICTALEKRG
jgi:hypothetical protein